MFKRAVIGFQRISRSKESRYATWISRNTVDIRVLQKRLEALHQKPRFIFIIRPQPDQNMDVSASINYLKHQPYTAWETVILTKKPYKWDVIPRKNIHYKQESRAEETLRSIRGDYIAFLSADDMVTFQALVSLAEAIIANRRPDLVYSDEVSIDPAGKLIRPIFKPDWSPDLLLTQYYLGNLTVFRRAAVQNCGGIDWSLGEVAAHDLALRISEKSDRIVHIPNVLIQKQVAVVDSTLTRKILDRAIRRRKIPVKVTEDEKFPGLFIPHWSATSKPPVSIIILNKDRSEYLAACLESILSLTSYPKFDVLLVDNDSKSRKTQDLYQHWLTVEPDRFRVIHNRELFNFSRFNNLAALEAKGELLLFLNNDTQLLSPNWLDEMTGQASRSGIGVVGCLLQFPNRTIQHAGIILSKTLIALHTHYRSPVSSPGHLGRLRVPAECSMVTGACLMIRKKLFRDLGGFDENLKVAYNDADLCLRARKAGYRNLILPQVRLVHQESITRGSDTGTIARSRFEMEKEYFLSKWGPIGVDPYYNPNFDQSRGDYSLPV
jgi:GT2 family glycosyltransferase